jgi:carbonic anhydrase
MRLLAVVFLSLCATTTALAQSGASWDYAGKRGPLEWGRLDPAYRACSDGHEQSPIDIRGAHLNTSLQPIEFHFIAGPVTLENTGNLIMMHVDPGSTMVADGVRYQLQRLEFHRPSENAVKGKLADLGVEMIYRSSDGKMAVVAARLAMDRGDPNAVLAELWPHLPKRAGATEKDTNDVDPGGFLPADRGYWTYTGSLTTPPCTEGVRWYVFEDALSLSRDQLRAYTAIFRMNSRPLQDTHGRRIEANE